MYLPEEDHSYGRPNRPGTPVGDVISNFYGDIASKVLTQKYDILQETQKPMSLKFARGHTKASTLAHSFISHKELSKEDKENVSKNLFKMRKFKNVKPRTDTNLTGFPSKK